MSNSYVRAAASHLCRNSFRDQLACHQTDVSSLEPHCSQWRAQQAIIEMQELFQIF